MSDKKRGSLHLRKGDRVKVISGKDRGLVGEVIAVYPDHNRVTVAGVNIIKRHLRDTSAQPQARQTTKGGIVSSEAPPAISPSRRASSASVSSMSLRPEKT